MSWLLAVDFGTSRTAAATRVDGQPPQPLTLQGGDQMRSCVAMIDGVLACGKPAFARARLAAGFEPSPKKLFSLPAGPFWGGRTVPAAEMVGTVLAYVLGEASQTRPDQPREVRLTHPAAWTERSPQLAALADAGKLALAGVGWDDMPLRFVAEPVAAALHAAARLDDQLDVGQSLAVYDLGAGTFDAAVVRRTSRAFEVVGETGSLPAGHAGNDFDQVIRDKLDERLADRFEAWALLAHPPEGDIEWEMRSRALDEAITAAKENLSDDDETIVDVPGLSWDDLQQFGRVTQGELDAWVGGKVDQTCRVLRQVIEGAEGKEGLTKAEIAYVVLTGGASKMRIVGTAVAEATSVRVLSAGNPKTVVALGATLADLDGKRTGGGKGTKTRRPPVSSGGRKKAAAEKAAVDAKEALERATAMRAEGRIPDALDAFKLAIEAGDPEWSPLAANNMGVFLDGLNDPAGASAAYRVAIESGHTNWASLAACNLGVLLLRNGDIEGAEGAFNFAISSGDPDTWPKAANGLGIVQERRADGAGAAAYYRRAIESGHADEAPRGSWNLGDLLKRTDHAGARAAYQRALDSGHREWASRAAIDLGLLVKTSDESAARAFYQRAIDLGNPDWAPLAWNNLAVLIEKTDKAGAKTAYQRAIDSGHKEWAPQAARNLGLLIQATDKTGAKAAYQRAIDSGHADWAPRAAVSLGVMLAGSDKDAAREAYQRAIDSGHADMAPLAWNNLGVLLQRTDKAAAKAAFERAIASGHKDVGPRAARNLGAMLVTTDKPAAMAAYQVAINSGHAEWGPAAAVDLGTLFEGQGDFDAARALYERAADSGHATWGPKGKAKLSKLQAREDRQELYKAARKVFKGFSRG